VADAKVKVTSALALNGNLWDLSVVGPFIMGSVQNDKADLVATLAGNPDDVVGAEPLS
jgi:hypothetical protein